LLTAKFSAIKSYLCFFFKCKKIIVSDQVAVYVA